MTSRATNAATQPGTGVRALFEDNARRAPDAVAVVCGALRLTYEELDCRAGEVAQRLGAVGLRPGGLVAVCLDRGPEVLVAMLGVLKAGGAYVPLEPTAPGNVLRHTLADTGVSIVLTVERYRGAVAQGADRRIVCLDSEAATGTAADPDSGSFDAPVEPGLACVLYTSGTTGAPKGALIEHGMLLGAYRAWESVYQLSSADRHLQVTATEFAGFTADWVRALCSGGTLVMAEDVDLANRTDHAAALHELIAVEGVTLLTGAVAVIRELRRHPRVHGLGTVRLIAGTGEIWDLDEQYDLRALAGPSVRLLNTYTLTEAAGSGAYFELPDGPPPVGGAERLSLIGAPFPGVTMSVVDEAGAPLGPGAVGEIAVSGPGVALGYLNGSRLGPDHLVRTGDLGLRQASGCLEFVGRLGEHTEVEAVLRGYSAVSEYLVADIGTEQGGRALAAYVVAADGGTVDPEHLRSYLSGRLPADRTPQLVVPVASLPRTRAGRADRAGVPLPVQRGAGRPAGGKGGRSAEPGFSLGEMAFATLLVAAFAWFLTDFIWPGSTDLSGVPAPWAELFEGLYVCECLAFGLGIAFFFTIGDMVGRRVFSGPLANSAHLALVWLLVAWWPQDNLYRLAAKNDWPQQAALVYGFNVTLMIAAAVLGAFLVSRPRKP
ncbi:acyl-CoA synthetase (AMP-forming)/AMP-acid ligase II [Streptacidiphilus sp. MAP12-16]|uniref:AMP-binding protein n=1 Tax=Streptacidiphilus sp. MAP12-16 TaxID=3156300 RepID=UPI003515A83F